MPAAFARTSTPPSWEAAASMIARTSSARATSPCRNAARAPRVRSAAATSSPPAAFRSATSTAAPSRAKRSAIARPMPEAPPVTTAVRPSRAPVFAAAAATDRALLLDLPARLSLLGERARPLDVVGVRPVPVDLAPAALERVAEAVLERGPHRALAGRDRGGRVLGDRRRDLAGACEQLGARHDLRDQPDPERAVRVDPLRAREQHHAHDLAERRPAEEADRLQREDLPDPHVRVEEGRVVGADREVRVRDEMEPRTEAHAVHRDDDGLVEAGANEIRRRAAIVRSLRRSLGSADRAGLGGVLQVGTRAEGLLARAGDDDDPHVAVLARAPERGRELDLEEIVAERVHALGPVQRD